MLGAGGEGPAVEVHIHAWREPQFMLVLHKTVLTQIRAKTLWSRNRAVVRESLRTARAFLRSTSAGNQARNSVITLDDTWGGGEGLKKGGVRLRGGIGSDPAQAPPAAFARGMKKTNSSYQRSAPESVCVSVRALRPCSEVPGLTRYMKTWRF